MTNENIRFVEVDLTYNISSSNWEKRKRKLERVVYISYSTCRSALTDRLTSGCY